MQTVKIQQLQISRSSAVLTLMSKRHALLLLVSIVLKAGGVSGMWLQSNNDELRKPNIQESAF